MNRHQFVTRLMTCLFMLLTTVTAWAQSGNWSDNRDETWGTDYQTASTFTITTPAQLAQFAYLVNSGSDFSGKTVTLDDGVQEMNFGGQIYQQPLYYEGDLSDHYWIPIGTAEHPFNGTFDGNGKSITYLKILGSNSYQGFFGCIGAGGTVQNLVFDYGSNISGSTQVGTLAGYNAGTVQNCLVLNATISGTGYVGSIIGQNAGTVTGCYSIDCSNGQDGMFALGADGSTTGVDSDGHAQCLYNLKADENTISSYNDFNVTVGSTTGVQVGSGVYYTDGIQYNAYHYFKTGSTTTLTYNIPGYDVTFAVSGTGSSISGNVVTVGTGKITVSLASKTVAEWSGSGNSADDPYIIYTREQLDMLATRVNNSSNSTPYQNKYFKLNNDLSYSDNNGDYDYHVIGTSTRPFCGVFDGNGKTISYASAGGDNESLQGLFGYIGEGGVVKNLGTKDCSFGGMNFIGVIAGDNAGTIENCRVAYDNSDNVLSKQRNNYYGTIAGRNSGTIRNCVSAGNIKADNDDTKGYNVGGIVGHNTGTVENCLYLGSQLEGMGYVGAIVGHNEGTLTNNYYHDNGYNNSNNHVGTTVLGVGTSGTLTGADESGAAKAKVVKLPEGGTFSNPYGATVSDTPTYVTTSNPNGMPLSVYSNGILFRDTYLANSNNLSTALYTTATTVELEALNVPVGYAATFSTTGDGASISGSTLTVGTDVTEVSVSAQRVATGWLADGVRAASFSTTGTNSITIMSADELGLLAYNVNFGSETYEGYTITLGTNIDLSGNTWEPIGYVASSGSGMGGYPGGGSSSSGFLGTFNGAAKPIQNMNVTGTSRVGLFSDVPSGAIVKNVLLSSPQVKGENYVGAIAGSVSGTVENCHVTYGNVEVPSTSEGAMGIGGIAGMLSGGSIKGCTVMDTNIYPVVAVARGIGGIAGVVSAGINYNTYSDAPAILQDCLFAGNMFKKDGNEYVGAITGMSQGGRMDSSVENTITNNYYIDGVSPSIQPSVTSNTTLYGINGADTDGARRGYAYVSGTDFTVGTLPSGIGTAGTQYAYSGVLPYTNGLYYNLKYYTPYPTAQMDITLSNDEDNSSLLNAFSGETGKVTLGGRTFYKDGSWNTICLPFGIDNINDVNCPFAGDGVELWQISNTDASGYDEDTRTLTLNFEDCYDADNNVTTLIAGSPYLIRWEKQNDYESNKSFYDIFEPTFTGVEISATSPIPDIRGDYDEITFLGTYSPVVLPENDKSNLFLGSGNQLHWPEGNDVTVNAFRCYFQLNTSSPVKDFVLNFGEGEPTSIHNSQLTIDNEAGAWYDLSGRKLQGKPTVKGMYIHGGLKVVIK